MTTVSCRDAAERFLLQARAELADGELPQASEKGWSAAVQTLKAAPTIATGSIAGTATSRSTPAALRSETGDAAVQRFLDSAGGLHENFYYGLISAEEISDSLDRVESLIERIPLLPAP